MTPIETYPLLLYAGAGLTLAGGLVSIVIIRVRRRHRQALQTGQSELSAVRDELSGLHQAHRHLQEQADGQVREYGRIITELKMTNATLETRIQRIPDLERTVAYWQERCDRLQAELRREGAALAQAIEKGQRVEALESDKRECATQLADLERNLSRDRATMAELKVLLEEERKQGAEKLALMAQARGQLKTEFENLAQQIFEEKGRKFADQNRTAMDRLITPLRDQIGEFKKRVEDVYDKETRDRTALQSEIHHLKELNRQISKEATNLTRALKGDSKTRGNWGEVVLERVLEASGLQKGREYESQVSLQDDSGKRYQPDVVVHLPENKDVIIDAKVTLKDYEAYYSSDDAAERARHLTAHIAAVRAHVRGLAAKRYEDLQGVRSLDFTLMFIPIEAAFLTAVEQDQDLFGEAFEKNIIVVGPSTLLVTLRTIETIWRHEYQHRNTQLIARKAGALYDKFVGFIAALEDVGQQLDRAQESYRTAYARLATGRGNLVRRSQELKALGIKANKELPGDLRHGADDEV